jgi:hypothetical protein
MAGSSTGIVKLRMVAKQMNDSQFRDSRSIQYNSGFCSLSVWEGNNILDSSDLRGFVWIGFVFVGFRGVLLAD